ncbi:hypothetical protein FOZ63_012103 [Perkinsus olseni]|uniref:Uncharacterized protein n=2 Tax=Perkinsus olseni TaxID=32597 RepID=A0A7J6PZJ8_PEROL|nr:hypothetical protein FOZ63_012103 [Perkinsus olseni]
MSRLLILLVIAFLRRVASFPPNKTYLNVDNEFFKSVWFFGPPNVVNIFIIIYCKRFPCVTDTTGNIPWDVSPDEYVLELKTTDENFKAFVEKYHLNVEDWKNIPFNVDDNTFTIQFHGHLIVLAPYTGPIPSQ